MAKTEAAMLSHTQRGKVFQLLRRDYCFCQNSPAPESKTSTVICSC
jgi:hypothetical protein